MVRVVRRASQIERDFSTMMANDLLGANALNQDGFDFRRGFSDKFLTSEFCSGDL
jgi:hypothetical protein